MIAFSWSQPICDECWIKRQGVRVPHRLKHPEEEKCADCGATTRAGIYIRQDPGTLNYPTRPR